jgi:hypothetical protein
MVDGVQTLYLFSCVGFTPLPEFLQEIRVLPHV